MGRCVVCGKYAEYGVNRFERFRPICRVCANIIKELWERKYK